MNKPRTVYQETKQGIPKFIRYKDGVKMYSMGMTKFQQIAKQAGAIYKVNQTVLVNTEILDAFLDEYNTDSVKMAEVIGVSEAQLRFR